jgi:methanogenic corrinoid protein MtbC1
MQQSRKTPTFNMKAVVRETGIRPDTLRAWERRYELPNPERTEGGHRIYSQRDVDTLKWLMARQEEGLSISHAVELFKRLEAEGQDPLLATGYGPSAESQEIQVTGLHGNTISDLLSGWLSACRSYDEQAADQILAEAFALFPVEQVCVELLQKGMAQIGQGWYEGETTVQQEHFASALAMRRLDALLAATPPASRPGKVILGCPPGEEHTFGLKLLALLLRRRGVDVTYLGANVPMDQMASAISAARPRLAVFLAHQLTSAATLRDVGDYLYQEKLPMAYGGRIFVDSPELQSKIVGYYLGDDLLAATSQLEHLMSRSELPPATDPLPEEYVLGLNHLSSRKAALESSLVTNLTAQGQSPERFASAADYLTRNVMAALKLGDMDLVEDEVQWIGGLMTRRSVDAGLLEIYLMSYKQSLIDTLDQRGQIIVDWFDDLLSRF